MTIKEFYLWAVQRQMENYTIITNDNIPCFAKNMIFSEQYNEMVHLHGIDKHCKGVELNEVPRRDVYR